MHQALLSIGTSILGFQQRLLHRCHHYQQPLFHHNESTLCSPQQILAQSNVL
jgi:hypothetical protein